MKDSIIFDILNSNMSEQTTMPTHVGYILDGNRRWAKENGLPTFEGHREGAERFREIALRTFDRGVKYVSAYVFSTENWQRTEEEVGYLMGLVIKAVDSYLEDYKRSGIKVVLLGSRENLDKKVLDALEHTESSTAHNTRGTLALCFNYGGKQEIADAVNAALTEGKVISVESIDRHLYQPQVPGIDLLIRTSGEERLSGFMLWRSDYAELYFDKCYWPDFDESHLDAALEEYASRKRRFGS
jgi:undecaprenyl diphosphate synthase